MLLTLVNYSGIYVECESLSWTSMEMEDLLIERDLNNLLQSCFEDILFM